MKMKLLYISQKKESMAMSVLSDRLNRNGCSLESILPHISHLTPLVIWNCCISLLVVSIVGFNVKWNGMGVSHFPK